MLKLLIKTAIARITNRKKFRIIKSKKRLEREKYDNQMIEAFGETRYKLSWWLGPWVLYTCNTAFYNPEPEETQEVQTEVATEG